ncbi:MAG: HPF/RaiA family ribosome-associated protein [Bacteroidota bacterium]
MNINIQAPWHVYKHLQNHIYNQLNKLTKYTGQGWHADVFLKTKANHFPEDKVIQVRLRLPGKELFAEAHADLFEKAISHATDKIKTQLLKRKAELQQH